MGIDFIEYFYIIGIEKEMSFFEITGNRVKIHDRLSNGLKYVFLVY